MTQEEKAKRYDEAIERLRNAFYDNNGRMCEEYRKAVIRVIEPIFPELKESEDERIRKELIEMVRLSCTNGNDVDKKIAWLEKQKGLFESYEWNYYKDKPVELWNAYINGKAVGLELGRNAVRNHPEDYGLEKQGEQKPVWDEKYIADVFEKVGLAKIVREQSNDNLTNALQDAMIELSKFIPQPNPAWNEEDKNMLKWVTGYLNNKMLNTSIAEERTACKNAIVWIEKQANHANFCNKIQIGDKVTRNEDGVLVNLSQLKRVAKPSEQNQSKQKPSDVRTTGYWNVQEVEQELAWSEKYIADVFEKVGLAKIVREQSNDNLTNALQDAMIELSKFIPQPNPTWSEEDCNRISSMKYLLHELDNYNFDNWLDSLKDKYTWKPSDAQIASITCAVRKMKESACYDSELVSLLNDLKKLRKE